MNTNKATSSKGKVIKVEYAKVKAIHASSMWLGEVISNHQVHAKAKVTQLANQVSHTMPRLRSGMSTPKGVRNTKALRCAKVKIKPQALKSKDNSLSQSVKTSKRKSDERFQKNTKAKITPTSVWSQVNHL